MRNALPSCLLRVAHVVGISVVRRSFIKKRSSISNAYAEFSVQFLRLGCTLCVRLTADESAQTLRGAELTQCVTEFELVSTETCYSLQGRSLSLSSLFRANN